MPYDAKSLKEKVVEASADYAATAVVDKMFPGLTEGDRADSFPMMEAADDIDKVSGWLQTAVTSALGAPAAGIGLPPGEAEISAECDNFVLAPITGLLERASTFVELAGLAVSLATGSHPLVLACLKPLAHTELEHALSQCFGEVVSGLLDAPQVGTHPRQPGAVERLQILIHSEGTLTATHATESDQFVPPEHRSVSSEAQNTLRDVTRDEPLWLCLAFMPKPPTRSTPATGTATIARKRDANKPTVLPRGEDDFLHTLPEALRGGSVAKVDLPTAMTMRDLPTGRHVILSMEGVGIAGLSTEIDSRIGYQHPGCRAGRCAPLGGPPCQCTCSVCLRP